MIRALRKYERFDSKGASGIFPFLPPPYSRVRRVQVRAASSRSACFLTHYSQYLNVSEVGAPYTLVSMEFPVLELLVFLGFECI